jgi:plasmid replication initiation protein
MFRVEKKYKLTADFIRWVVEPAKRELDAKSPYSFEYTPLKTGRKITSIKFYPVEIPQNKDEELEKYALQKQISPSLMFNDKMNWQYLREHYNFSMPELQNNIDLFKRAEKEIPDFLRFMSEVKAKANRASNPKGYLINALRKKLGISTKGKK